MTTEEKILEKLAALDRLEAELAPMIRAHKARAELLEDLAPLQRKAMALFMGGLQEVESGFQVEDLGDLLRKGIRNTQNFTDALGLFESLMDFLKDLEPLMKLTVPKLISYLDDLERRGVFRILKIWVVDFREKIAASYGTEEAERIVDGIVALIGLARILTDEKTVAFLEDAAKIPGLVRLDQCEDVGPVGLASAAFDKEVRKGLGVMLELTKAMGRIRNGSSDR